MNEHKFLKEDFRYIGWLLAIFDSDISGSKTDKEIIAGFVSDLKDSSQVKETLKQGRQFLALDELPMQWIDDLCQRYPCSIEGDVQHILEDTEENYRSWIEWMIEEIEREAKRQGKL
jgi:hypothetical protein